MPESKRDLLLIDNPLTTYDGILLGVDFGLRRIGFAIGQTLTQTANPLDTILAQGGIPSWTAIDKIIQAWQPLAIIIGIPLNMDGTAQSMTHRARRFALDLKFRFQLPVHGMDERLTSFDARQALFDEGGYRAIQKNKVDALAAKLILEEWMATNLKI